MEFRPMRRKRQELPKEECEKILHNATAGVLSVLGDGGYPYGVPISYVYAEGKLYFHSPSKDIKSMQSSRKTSARSL